MAFGQVLRSYNKSKVVDLIKNAGWIFFDRIFRMGTGLLVGVWIARYLGPSEFGVLNYVSIFPFLFTAFAGLGLTSILFNEFIVEQTPLSTKILLVSSIFARFIAGVISYILVIIISLFMHDGWDMNVLIAISALSVIVQSFDVIDIYFQSHRVVQYSILTKLVVFLAATIFRIYGVQNNLGLRFFVSVTSAELIVSSLFLSAVYTQYVKLKFSDIQIHLSLIKRLLTLAWPIMLSELFLFLYARIDLIMLKHLSNDLELGNYSVTTRLTDIWYFIPIAITTSLGPSILKVRMSDYQEYLKRYRYLFTILASISIAIGLVFTLTADTVVNILYGSQYQDVGRLLSINIWTSLFVFLAIGSDRWFIVENLQKYVLIRTILGAIVNVVLNFVLIPLFGAFGASIATLVAQVFASYLLNGLYTKTREVFQLQTDGLMFIPHYIIRSIRRRLFKQA